MKLKIFLILVVTLSLFILSACTYSQTKTNNTAHYKIEYQTINNDGKTYYKVNEQFFKYKNKVIGKSNNAKLNSYYVVLSNSDISFKEADEKFWSNYLDKDLEFVIVEQGFIK